MSTSQKIHRMIQLGEMILNQACAGFSNEELLQAQQALTQVLPHATEEQRDRIERIQLHIATQLMVRGVTPC